MRIKSKRWAILTIFTNLAKNIIDQMLEHMFGTTGDHIHDRLLHFTTAVNGGYYFAPSDELLAEIIDED